VLIIVRREKKRRTAERGLVVSARCFAMMSTAFPRIEIRFFTFC
jgi:hypothetical protein